MSGNELPAPFWFFGFDSFMEFIAFAIAMAVAFQAMKGYTLSRERTLLYLNISFLLLGAGLLVDGLANLIVLLSRFHRNLLYLSLRRIYNQFPSRAGRVSYSGCRIPTTDACFGRANCCSGSPDCAAREQPVHRAHPNLPTSLYFRSNCD